MGIKRAIIILAILILGINLLNPHSEEQNSLEQAVSYINKKHIDIKEATSHPDIPRIIHYVWLGGEEPPLVKKAIHTWIKNMPGWEIKRWNETNCDIEANEFVKKAYKLKQYNFASDYCRVAALEKEGGLYLDTDMFLNQSLIPLMTEPVFLTLQSNLDISGGIFAFPPHHPIMVKILEFYNTHFFSYEKNFPSLLTEEFRKYFQPQALLNAHQENQYIIYPANIGMLNFGGGENVSEHWYAANNAGYAQPGIYYQYFSDYFLKENAYQLVNYFGENKHGWVIIHDQEHFYLSKGLSEYANDLNIRKGKYSFSRYYPGRLLTLYFPNQKPQQFKCLNKKCSPVFRPLTVKEGLDFGFKISYNLYRWLANYDAKRKAE